MTKNSERNSFFIKLISFLGMLSVIASAVPLIAVFRISSYSYKLPEDKNIIFLGDSHIAQGVDDSVIPGAFNSSVSADTYLTGYLRLKLLLRDNPQRKTVFVGVSPYSISRGSDETMFRPSLVMMKVPYYLPHFSGDEILLYLNRSPKNFLRSVFGSPSVYLRSSKLNNKKYFKKLGAFNPRKKRSLKAAIAGTSTLEKPLFWGNEMELIYLKKIVDLCGMAKIRLIFLDTPIFHAEKYLDVFYYRKMLREYFPNVELWDYLDLPISDDLREDVNHLNAWGATKFGEILAERIKEKLND